MGAEATITARVKGKVTRGHALLETNEVIFRAAGARAAVKLDAATRAAAKVKGGWLELGDALALELGADVAAKWLEKIRNPKSVLDKLGVKPGQTATLLGAHDEAFVASLEKKGLNVTRKLAPGAALIFLAVESQKALGQLPAVRGALAPDGALWLIRPKGKGAAVGENETRSASRAAGLVDVKVVGFSDTHSAEKYVVPLAKRK